MLQADRPGTGIAGLDRVLGGVRPGDNLVWQVDSVADFQQMVIPYVAQAVRDGRPVVYVRFADHPPLLDPVMLGNADLDVYQFDPKDGFETFAAGINRLITSVGDGAAYVFDCLTALLDAWHSDLAVMNFFKVSCPYLYELNTLAYFALLRHHHTLATSGGIRETTQVLLDLHVVDGETYVRPLKVWDRHSETMFFTHRVHRGDATPITSGEMTSRMSGVVNRRPPTRDHWQVLLEHCWAAFGAGGETEADARETLLAVMVGRRGRMVELCRRYFDLADLLGIASRMVGSGAVGGKSVGMLVARAILDRHPSGRFRPRLEPHDSFFFGSDLYYTYLIANGWWHEWARHKTPDEYFVAGAELSEKMRHGAFPPVMRERMMPMLDYFGQAPIIVRSSSLLEDNYGNTFAGKYDSVFCANQGSREERLAGFEDAVRTVYASTMSKEALTYRRDRGLDELDEQMGLLVQRVSGGRHGDYFFPHAGGVGNSENLYEWARDIDRNAGMLRLVAGLGTRAVDRTVVDYARIVTLDDPARLPQTGADDRARYSQHLVDVLSLDRNELVTLPLRDINKLDIGVPWDLFLTDDRETIRRFRQERRRLTVRPQFLDFAELLRRTDLAGFMRELMDVLEESYGTPVDIEFTVNLSPDDPGPDPDPDPDPGRDAGHHPDSPRGQDTPGYTVNLVQCRPLQTRSAGPPVEFPVLTDPRDCFVDTNGEFMGGNVQLPLEYVVMVRPERYLLLGQQDRYAVGKLVGAANRALAGHRYLLVGPGRWGTTTPSLGVPVHYNDINNAVALAEVTYPEGGFLPELSYGSHFFGDLVERDTFYFAVFAERSDVSYHPERVLDRPNELADLVGGAGAAPGPVTDAVHVARFEDLVLYSDVVTQRLLCR